MIKNVHWSSLKVTLLGLKTKVHPKTGYKDQERSTDIDLLFL